MKAMLTCEEVTTLITRYLEGQMEWRQRVAFRCHVALCPHCRRYLRQMQATIAALGRLPEEPPPSEVREALLKHYRAWNKPPPPSA